MSVNKAFLVGNLGKEPELKHNSNGTAVCKFVVATSEKYKDEEKTIWHNVVAYAKTGENCERFLSKGSKVFIEGKIDNYKYEKDGETKYGSQVVAFNVQFLDSKPKSGDTPQQKKAVEPEVVYSSEEIPF